MGKMDGRALDPGVVQVMLEIINGGPEIGRLPPDARKRYAICAPTLGPKIGRIQVHSTVEDMDRGKPLWWDDFNKKQ